MWSFIKEIKFQVEMLSLVKSIEHSRKKYQFYGLLNKKTKNKIFVVTIHQLLFNPMST